MGILRSLYLKICSSESRIRYYRKQGVKIGNGCFIANDVNFGSEPYLVTIGDNVRLTENVSFSNHDGGLWVVRRLYKEYENVDIIKPIVVGNNVHIGVDAVILPGVKIGNNCIIGYGAIVTKDIPDNCIAVGVPARVIETIDEYIGKNKDLFISTKRMNATEKKQYLMERGII